MLLDGIVDHGYLLALSLVTFVEQASFHEIDVRDGLKNGTDPSHVDAARLVAEIGKATAVDGR